MLNRPWSRIAPEHCGADLNAAQSAHWLDWVGDPDTDGARIADACRAEASLRRRAAPSRNVGFAGFRNDLLLPIGLTKPKRCLGIVNASTLDRSHHGRAALVAHGQRHRLSMNERLFFDTPLTFVTASS